MVEPVIPIDHPCSRELAGLRVALEGCWSAETSFWSEDWTPGLPSFGQCAVTALIVHDRLGGEICRTTNEGVLHYWNRVSGVEVDLTRDQFEIWAPEGDVVTVDRNEVAASGPTLAARHRRLVAALDG